MENTYAPPGALSAARQSALAYLRYKYSHDHEGGWVDQAYLPEERRYYEPTDRGFEATIRARLEELRRRKESV